MRNLTIPVGQTATEAMHKNNRPGRRTGDNVVDQGHWTVPFSVFTGDFGAASRGGPALAG